MASAIDLRPDHRKTVEDILRDRLPDGVQVWVFGSRADWTSKDSSDLDLALEGDGPLDTGMVMALELAFEESLLPFRVDVVDLARVDERFRDNVVNGRIALMGGAKQYLDDYRQHSVSELIEAGVLEIGDGYRAKNSELASSGLPFARAANVQDGFRFENADFFPEANLDRAGRGVSQVGDVAFTSKGTVGRVAFVRDDTPRFVYAPQVCYWRSLDHRQVAPRFLYCWMRGEDFRNQLNAVSGQTDMADFVSLRDQRQMRVALPPPPDQRAIARVLGALDDRIALHRRMNQTLEAMARALFKSWFVDFDPVRAKMEGREPGLPPDIADLFPDRLVALELDEVPDGWSVLPLDQIAVFRNGLALQKYRPEGDEDWLPVLKIAQLRAGMADGAEKARASIPPEVIVDDGDIVFSWSGSLELRVWTGGPAALNQHLFKVTSEVYPKWFFFHCVALHLNAFRAIAAGKATTMGHIKREHLREARCVVPDHDLLEAVRPVFEPLLHSVIRHRILARTLAVTRDTLLPRLVSGEIRLPAALVSEVA